MQTSSAAATVSPTALSNGGNSTQFFFILGVSVAALLVIIILLLLILIFLFGYKCIKRCGRERLANKTITESANNTNRQSMTSFSIMHMVAIQVCDNVNVIIVKKYCNGILDTCLYYTLSSYMLFP